MKQHTASELIFKSDLSTRARIVFMYLSYRSNKENTCFPSIKTIARECGMAVSTVKRALGDLESSGYIRKVPRYRDDNGQTSNLYTLVEQNQLESVPLPANGPVMQTEQFKPEESVAIIAEEMEVAVKTEEQNVHSNRSEIKAIRQSCIAMEKHSTQEQGGGHLHQNMLVPHPLIHRSPTAIYKQPSAVIEGEPPPGSYP